MPVRSPATRPASPLENRRRSVSDRRQSTTERRQPPEGIPERLSRRAIVERIRPAIDNGRWPIKRTVGETVQVWADIIVDGHDVVVAVVRDRQTATASGKGEWRQTPMTLAAPGTDEWTAAFTVGLEPGWHEYDVVACVDHFLSWRRDLGVRAAAGQDLSVELLEGALLVREGAARAAGATESAEGDQGSVTARADRDWLLERADALGDATPVPGRLHLALDEELRRRMDVYSDRSRATTSATMRVRV